MNERSDGRFSLLEDDGTELSVLADAFKAHGHGNFAISKDGTQIVFGHDDVPNTNEVRQVAEAAGISRVVFSSKPETV